MKTLKWPGFALVAFGVAVFPFAIWFPGPWGVISLVMIMAGCVLLVLSLKGAGLMGNDQLSDVPDGEAGAGDAPDKPAD